MQLAVLLLLTVGGMLRVVVSVFGILCVVGLYVCMVITYTVAEYRSTG